MRKNTILIIDDEAEIRDLLQKRLYQSGYDVDVAANGKHAIQKISARKKYDVIVSDLRMPMIDGSEFVNLVRRAGLKAPIVLITGQLLDTKWVDAAYKMGINAVIFKPFTHDILLKKIEDLLSLSGQTAA